MKGGAQKSAGYFEAEAEAMQSTAFGYRWNKATSSHVDKTPSVCEVCESDDGMASLTCGDMGLFTGPHQTSFSDPSSLTMRLSRGERPVFDPE